MACVEAVYESSERGGIAPVSASWRRTWIVTVLNWGSNFND